MEFDAHDLKVKLKTVFKPAMPINRFDLFAKREAVSQALLAAINQNGQHAIMFGERGVGKTSLANVLTYLLRAGGIPKLTPHVSCVHSDNYEAIWARVFIEVLEQAERNEIDLPRECMKLLRLANENYPGAISLDVVRRVLTAIGDGRLLVVVLDEFDRISDATVRIAMADTIKYLSDRNAPCTIVVIGVADDVNRLIENHQSIERCLMQIRMPRMSRDELESVIKKSLAVVDMKIEVDAVEEISRVAIGLPNYAHLLGLHSANAAVDEGSLSVNSRNVKDALSLAVQHAEISIRQAYLRATESPQTNAIYEQVLIACALAETNEFGYFSPVAIRDPLTRILRKPAKMEHFNRHLAAFCGPECASVLERITIRGRPRYRFANALLQPFALIKGLSSELITEDDLREIRRPKDRLF